MHTRLCILNSDCCSHTFQMTVNVFTICLQVAQVKMKKRESQILGGKAYHQNFRIILVFIGF